MKHSYYRPDIDGLRAVAVIAVILFHFDIGPFTGGFVGVDIFFVISGFLITSLLLRELEEGQFSFWHFWERRIRRILPALMVVLIATAIASYYIMLYPANFIDFGATLAAQSLFAVNYWFMGQESYFAAPHDTIPLLHTWSLAVEEQFYIIFPFLLFGLFRFGRNYVGYALTSLGILSFIYGVHLVTSDTTGPFTFSLLPHLWGNATNASAAFYFTLARMWELLLGAVLAALSIEIKHKNTAETISLIGLLLIIGSTLYIKSEDAFPGLISLLPTLGTAAIIVANIKHVTFSRKILENQTVVLVGLMSYSLYIWHWPLLVFLKNYSIEPVEAKEKAVLLVVTFILSYLTYRFIEKPIRSKELKLKRSFVYGSAFIALSVTFFIGSAIAKSDGLPQRAPTVSQSLAAAIIDIDPRHEECFKKTIVDIEKNKLCYFGSEDKEDVDIVLWGDSHADAVLPAIDKFAKTSGQAGVFFGVSGCGPFVNVADMTNDESCIKENRRAIEFITENETTQVYLVSEWRNGYEYTGQGAGRFLAAFLSETIEEIPENTKVIIFERIPTYPNYNFRDLYKISSREPDKFNTKLPKSWFREDAANIQEQIRLLADSKDNVSTLDPKETLCDEKFCYLNRGNTFYYRDSSHLSRSGAIETILPLLEKTSSSSSTTD